MDRKIEKVRSFKVNPSQERHKRPHGTGSYSRGMYVYYIEYLAPGNNKRETRDTRTIAKDENEIREKGTGCEEEEA